MINIYDFIFFKLLEDISHFWAHFYLILDIFKFFVFPLCF